MHHPSSYTAERLSQAQCYCQLPLDPPSSTNLWQRTLYHDIKMTYFYSTWSCRQIHFKWRSLRWCLLGTLWRSSIKTELQFCLGDRRELLSGKVLASEIRIPGPSIELDPCTEGILPRFHQYTKTFCNFHGKLLNKRIKRFENYKENKVSYSCMKGNLNHRNTQSCYIISKHWILNFLLLQ